MAHISPDEIRKLARLSAIELDDREITMVSGHIQAVLSYAARVQEVLESTEYVAYKNTNITRDDQTVACNPKPLLSQAPEVQDNFFVVPAIIDQKS
jgi:aspartyl/glutamyl-tRNA(Asn/Gln) amidotransferase C subunit